MHRKKEPPDNSPLKKRPQRLGSFTGSLPSGSLGVSDLAAPLKFGINYREIEEPPNYGRDGRSFCPSLYPQPALGQANAPTPKIRENPSLSQKISWRKLRHERGKICPKPPDPVPTKFPNVFQPHFLEVSDLSSGGLPSIGCMSLKFRKYPQSLPI